MAQPFLTAVSDRRVLDVLEARAEARPGDQSLVAEAPDGSVVTLSWAQVLDRSQAVARRLAEAGVGPGDRLHVHLPNRLEFVLALFACAQLGAAIVPTNTASSVDELAFVLEHSGAAVSLTDIAGRAAVDAATGRGSATVLVCEEEDLLGLPAGVPGVAPADPGADLGVLYTSGTTSRPKGVRVTQANYLWAGEVVAGALRLRREDRVLTCLPLFHANAQYYTTMGALMAGATLVLLPRFSASRFLAQAVRHRATVASLFAAPIRMILAQGPRALRRDHRLRAVLFAQNITDAEHAHWRATVGAPLVQLYGMTETIGPPVINPLAGPARPHAMGRVSVGYACRVLREDGGDAAVGESGQLLVAGVPGVTLMRGYLDDPAATDRVLRDGWLHTGDVVRVEPGGYLSFVDRRKDMIKRGGENVAASEVESVLLAHPAVREAAVLGIPEPMRDEEIVAVVVLEPGATTSTEELIAWCAERLASFRVPGRMLVQDELPRTAVGKIQKGVLRSAIAEGGVDAG
jgi:crotonobetaine/carnitine-CoA ligase